MKAVDQKSKSDLISAGFNENSTLSTAESLEFRWKNLCEKYLPLLSENQIWRFNRERKPQDAEQGWKLHVSATILTAGTVLEKVASFLQKEDAYFKAPALLAYLKRINSGIYYDYSQIGKFITVYPQNNKQAVYFAERLHQLTFQIPAPAIPYDQRFKPESCVYYRYGAFRENKIKQPDGTFVFAMRDPDGNLVPDLRDSAEPYPAWVVNPFPEKKSKSAVADSPFKKIRIIRALSQRGKGGVYQGIDFSDAEPRLCLIKEGRKNGEVSWDGRDGYWRVRHEESVIKKLGECGLDMPQIYNSFQSEENYYLITEFIAGENLHGFLRKCERLLTLPIGLKYAIRITEIMLKIHSAGWLWRDCKPENLIVTPDGNVRVIDFEGACPIANADPLLWGTLTTNSPRLYEKFFSKSAMTPDMYALGAVIYLLFEGELPAADGNFIPKFSRADIPAEIKELISKLLDLRETRNCKASEVLDKLQKAFRTQAA
ncbi:MAG: protein kinase [Pyrinomonadaceae bacterium]|nr:protein kinase [Pyrinomonadaceae bacterium]